MTKTVVLKGSMPTTDDAAKRARKGLSDRRFALTRELVHLLAVLRSRGEDEPLRNKAIALDAEISELTAEMQALGNCDVWCS